MSAIMSMMSGCQGYCKLGENHQFKAKIERVVKFDN